MSKSNLLVELYSNIGTTGALTFSSKSLVKKMLSYASFKESSVLVEFGGGDGSITQGIIDRMSNDSELWVFEINKSFCEEMEKQFPQPNVRIINDSAENLDLYLGGKKADYVLSSLPFSLIPKEVTDQILIKTKTCLKPEGKFIQICYSYFLKGLFRKYFQKVEAQFTLKNFPPAFVMICKD